MCSVDGFPMQEPCFVDASNKEILRTNKYVLHYLHVLFSQRKNSGKILKGFFVHHIGYRNLYPKLCHFVQEPTCKFMPWVEGREKRAASSSSSSHFIFSGPCCTWLKCYTFLRPALSHQFWRETFWSNAVKWKLFFPGHQGVKPTDMYAYYRLEIIETNARVWWEVTNRM